MAAEMKTTTSCEQPIGVPKGSCLRPPGLALPHPAARPAACLGMLKGCRARRRAYTGHRHNGPCERHPKRASRRDESKTSFTFTETAWRQLQLRMRTLVLPIATAAMMRLPAFSRIWARCRFAHSCCRVLLAQARSWPDSSWSDGLVTGVVTLFSYPSACTATARPVPPLEKGRSSTLLDVTDRVRRFISLFAWAPCVLLQLDPRRDSL